MSSSSSSSMDLISSMIWSPYQTIHQLLPTFYHRTSSESTTLIHLNDNCLWMIYYYLDFIDLVRCRRVCHHLQSTIDDYLKLIKNFQYGCHLNGIELRFGQYQFNIDSFEFWIKHMPSIKRLRFEQCHIMRNTLSHCNINLFNSMTKYINNLKELHIGRALFINQHTIKQLIDKYPLLTHLTITIYDEELLLLIITKFKHLYYLNLDESIIYNYSSSLKNLSTNIRCLILPSDTKNEKSFILKSICDGPGINLERLEIRTTINNLYDDRQYFDMIGQMLIKLQWLQLDLSSSIIFDTNFNRQQQQQEINNNNNNFEQNYDRYLNLISGIHRLIYLRVLILKEKDYFDDNYNEQNDDDDNDDEDDCIDYDNEYNDNNNNNNNDKKKICHSLFDDYSMLKIFKNCSKLIMLSISSSLCCNRKDYARYTMNRKHDDQNINRLLNKYFNNRFDNDNNSDCIINKMDEQNDSGFDNNNNNNDSIFLTKLSKNSISDQSLSTIDYYLPKLQILRLRGVRIGQRTLIAIQNLEQLKFFRLDSIRFNRMEKLTIKKSFENLMSTLTNDDYNDNNNLKSNDYCLRNHHRTSIHLTNIPLI